MFKFAKARWVVCEEPPTTGKHPLALICRADPFEIRGHYFMSVDGNVYCRNFKTGDWAMLVDFHPDTVQSYGS